MSAKTVAQKLQIKPDTTVWSSHDERLGLLQPFPECVQVVAGPGEATTALVFADDAGSLREILDTHQEQLAHPTAFWIAYPKANRTDINRDTLWPILTEYGMRPISQVAV